MVPLGTSLRAISITAWCRCGLKISFIGWTRRMPWRSSTLRSSRSVMVTPSRKLLSALSCSAAPGGTASMARWKLSPTLTISRAKRVTAYLAVSSRSRSDRLRMFSTSACALSSRSLRSAASACRAAMISWGVRCSGSAPPWGAALGASAGAAAPSFRALAFSRDWSCGLSPMSCSAVFGRRPIDGLLLEICRRRNQPPAVALRSCPISGSGRKKSSQQAAHELGREIHHRDDAGVVEACRPDDAEDPHHLALLVLKPGDDQRRPREREQLVFRADEDVHALSALGQAQELDEVALGLEVGKELANALQVLQAVDVFEQVGLAANDQALLLIERARPRGDAGLDHLLRQPVELGLGGGELSLDGDPRLVQGQATDVGVEVIGSLDQARSRQPGRQLDDPVLHVLIVPDQDHERLAGLERHEVDMLDPAHLLFGEHHARAVRQPGDHLAGIVEHLLDGLLAPDPELRLDVAPLLIGKIADLEQAVDEHSEPRLGRQAARRRTPSVDQPQMFQVRHDVTDRRR